MFCSKCGTQNPDNQVNCTNCGAPLAAVSLAPRPKNYLAWSIVTTVLCCLIGGIVAIVYSAQVDSKYNAGDYAGAQQSSDSARKWNIGSMIVGLLVNLIYVVAMVAGGLSGMR